MSNTSSISDFELERATTAGAHDAGVAVDDVAAETKTPKKKVVAADTEGVETA
jgi:hypothetical protein